MAGVMAALMGYPPQQTRREPQGLWAALVAALVPDGGSVASAGSTVAPSGAHLAFLARLPAPDAGSILRSPEVADPGVAPIVQPSWRAGTGTATGASEEPVAPVIDLAAWRARRH
jgi:hypothetical protein